jgi:hypothetical protein
LSVILTRSGALRTVFVAASALALAGGFAAAGSAAVAGTTGHASVNYRRACAVNRTPGIMSCMVLVRTDVKQQRAASLAGTAPVGYAYGPADLQGAYNLTSA